MAAERASDLSMSQHPDIVALRERFERAFETPQAWASNGLLFMAAAYAAISPWVVGFNGSSRQLAVSNLVIGLVLLAMTMGFATTDVHMHGLTWVAPLLGVWLIIAPWVVRGTDQTAGVIANNVATGACVVVLGAAMAAMALRRPRR